MSKKAQHQLRAAAGLGGNASRRPMRLITRKGFAPFGELAGKCPTGKIRFRDRKEAVAAMHQLQFNGKRALEVAGFTTRQERRTYKCKQCNGVHLTSKPKWGEVQQAKAA